MRIAIIGAGISGLTAGRVLKNAGHEVVIFEKSRGFGGRLSTRYVGEDFSIKLDHGVPYLSGQSREFQNFLNELRDADLIKPWNPRVQLFRKNQFIDQDLTNSMSIAKKGMNTIGSYLSDNLDVRLKTKVSGIDSSGASDGSNRTWTLALENDDDFVADAVILSAPSRQTIEILEGITAHDSIDTILNVLKSVEYQPKAVMMVGYTEIHNLNWDVLNVEDSGISWVSHENSKRHLSQQCLVIHSTTDLAEKYIDGDRGQVEIILKEELGKLLGEWAARPEWSQVHFWRYSQATNPLEVPYIASNEMEIPLAVVGSYMKGNSVESAYLSGLRLAEKWLESFS